MPYLDPETQAELNRQRMTEEIQSIRLQNKALSGKGIVSVMLALLGAWMVARGEKLHQRNSAPQTRYSELNKRTAHR